LSSPVMVSPGSACLVLVEAELVVPEDVGAPQAVRVDTIIARTAITTMQ